jgi:uncharacterized membrane protein YhaH (DUF805 family)
MSWYIKVLSNYATFSGRARRKEYWMFFLFNFIAAFIIGFTSGFIGSALHQGDISRDGGLIYNLAVLLPSLAVAVRRMHDSGRSGWWILFPFVNLVLLCFDSEPGDNKYGPNPKMVQAPQAMGGAG